MRNFRFSNQIVDTGLQTFHIIKRFPQFKFFRNGNGLKWIGELQSTNCSKKYKIEIIYRGKKTPKVFILAPKLESNAPHTFSDGSLCLCHPNDNSWKQNDLISCTIIPWVAEWIYFYEVWKDTGIWFGREASHKGKKLIN